MTRLMTGASTREFSFPALSQNLGIAVALAGGTFRDTDLLCVGVLLIALGLLLRTDRSPELDRRLELPLLIVGLLAFGLLALFFLAA